MGNDNGSDLVYGILLLAAGLGRRYRNSVGRGEKLMALHSDENGAWVPLIELTIRNAVSSGLKVAMVCRPESAQLQKIAADYQVQIILLASRGSGETIAAGVAATADWNGWIIMPADMGWILPRDYILVNNVLQQVCNQVRLMWGNQPGHPVGFSDKYKEQLLKLAHDRGAKEVLNDELLVIQGTYRVVKDADYYASHN